MLAAFGLAHGSVFGAILHQESGLRAEGTAAGSSAN
jgi:hypothetical protein